MNRSIASTATLPLEVEFLERGTTPKANIKTGELKDQAQHPKRKCIRSTMDLSVSSKKAIVQ